MIIPFLVVFAIVYAGPKLVRLAGWADLSRWSLTLVGLLISGIIVVALARLNPHILAWRKARGRDIEEEERYETDQGMIRLIPIEESDRDH